MSPPQLEIEEMASLMDETRGGTPFAGAVRTTPTASSTKGSFRSCWLVSLAFVGALVLLAFFTDSIEITFNRAGSSNVLDKNDNPYGTTDLDAVQTPQTTQTTPTTSSNDKVNASTGSTFTKNPKKKAKKNKPAAALPPPLVHQPPPQEPGYKARPSSLSDTYSPRAKPMDPTARQALATKYGSWTLKDPKADQRPDYDFYQPFPSRDIPRSKFPATAWQVDAEYLGQFLPAAKALVERSMEAILEEYGHSPAQEPGKSLDERSAGFALDAAVDVQDPAWNAPKTFDTAGWSTPRSLQGLMRRMLHAVMTEDQFTVAMGGHSASAGHGNNFRQSYTVVMQKALEPVMARLGVKMTAHNFGMGGLGTIQNSVAAGDLYGQDMDYVIWDSGMTEKGSSPQDCFARQSLMAAERSPVIVGMAANVMKELYVHADADILMGATGSATAGMLGVPLTDDAETVGALPWAAQYIRCSEELKQECKKHRYHSSCWIERDDVSPTTKQAGKVGGQASWHPGYKFHLLTSRVLTFPILKALHEAITLWLEAPGYALPDDAWHMADYYANIRNKTMFMNETIGSCKDIKDLPDRVCSTSMHARSEYLPRRNPGETSIRTMLKFPEQIDPVEKNLYDPPDVRETHLEVPDGAVDYLNIVENGVEYVPNKGRIITAKSRRLKELPATSRVLANPVIKPGKGFALGTHSAPHLCDGSYYSFCGREASNNCLLSGHNDNRGGIFFDAYSGWLILNVPAMKAGLLMLRMETWHVDGACTKTKGWTCENNENCNPARRLGSSSAESPLTENDTSPVIEDDELPHWMVAPPSYWTGDDDSESPARSRSLKTKIPPMPYCDEFTFEFAIDGKITSWDKDNIEGGLMYTLMDDSTFMQGKTKDIELAIRQTGCGRTKPLHLTHVYWA